jgi:hypothetical protein
MTPGVSRRTIYTRSGVALAAPIHPFKVIDSNGTKGCKEYKKIGYWITNKRNERCKE